MKVFTPGEMARHTGSKYLGVLVASRFARHLNALRRGQDFGIEDPEVHRRKEKMTTTALEATSQGAIPFRLVDRAQSEL